MRAGSAGALILAVILGGCAGPSLLLLDDEDGGAQGQLAVLDQSCAGEATIGGAYSRTKLRGCSPRGKNIDPASLTADERGLLELMPPPPARFTMYFIPNTTALAPGSEGMIEALRVHLAARPGAEMEIVGHTDTTGSAAANQALSERRAEQIKARLVELNFPPDVITTTGRGETDLRFPTPDETENGGNRRVEIIVR
ncbi:OmpA family protein [Blastomonas sp.]|uniref:OmpA family protein n=1 Tax=Blastomonas sp. TaxID=1909299 RepID=UPI0035932CF5